MTADCELIALWQERQRAQAEAYALSEAQPEVQRAWERVGETEDRIIGAPARSPAGLAVKLRLVTEGLDAEDHGLGARALRTALMDAERLAERHAP